MKQEAKELIEKYYDEIDETAKINCGKYCQGGWIETNKVAKQCAPIALQHTIDELDDLLPTSGSNEVMQFTKLVEYHIRHYKKIKIEIQKA